jgi:hypothetical protein
MNSWFLVSDEYRYINAEIINSNEGGTHRDSAGRGGAVQARGKVPAVLGRKYPCAHPALIYSTKVVVHFNQLKVKSLLAITKRHLWLEDETPRKRNACLPLSALLHVLKAEQHPELVLIAD